jgi:hypothetical protein
LPKKEKKNSIKNEIKAKEHIVVTLPSE